MVKLNFINSEGGGLTTDENTQTGASTLQYLQFTEEERNGFTPDQGLRVIYLNFLRITTDFAGMSTIN